MIRTILALMLGCLSLSTLGQSGYTVTITGPTSVSLGTTYVYNVSWKYNGTPTSAPPNGTFDWTVFGGTASSKGINSAPVQWSTLPGYILYEYWAGGSYYYATLNVSSNSCAPKPVVSFSLSSDVCAPRQLSYTGTPPSGVTWYWQTSSSGTSMSNSTNSYSVVTPGTYYVRAYNNASSCWGSESASYTVSTVTAGPPVPTTPTADTNTCGSKALFHDDPPTGVTWYWQQTADGTSMSNPGVHLAQQTGAYYLRARDNSSGCWSAGSASIYVTVDNGPSNTPAFAVSTNECGVKTLTKPVADPGVQLFWQGTNSSGTDTSEPAQAQTYTANVTGTYYLRAASSNGCWGEPYSSLIEVDGPLPEVPTGLTASDITTSSFTAQWTPTANAYDYVVEVALYGSFSNPLKTITMSNNSAAIADLSAGENYHFRVRARNECGKSVISAPVPVQLPTEPPVALPATVVTSSSFLINWQQVNGATAYYFDLATDISFTPSSLIFDNANTSSASGFTGNPNGPILVYNMPLETQAYYYRIRAANSAGSSANSNVITVLPLSAAPVAKPATNVTKTSFVANWNTVPWTNEFRVDVSTDKEFTSMVSGYEDVPVTGNSLLVENLGRGRVYYYRVRSAVPTAVSANSNTIMVVTNNDYNYIKYTDVTIGQLYTAEQVAGVSIGDKLVKYDYFDGKGRLLQTVMQQASPLGADVVQPIEYDTFGRQAKQFLPYVAPSANGQFRHQFVEEQWQFYANGPANVAKDAYPYTLTVFEHSPLNRVVKQGAPGGTWQPDGNESYESTDRTVKFAYQVNAVADQVILWTYVPSTSYPLGLVTSGTGTGPSYYLTGELYKTKSKDEHNNEVVEFKDKEDRIILKRVQAPGNAWAETYYIYDDRGNLVTVLPPMATAGLNEEYFGQNEAAKDAYLHRWAFRYAYDGRNRMSQKQVPGAAPVYMVYDEFNRLVLTQDGNQRQSNQWAFTKYDALNRPVLTGIYTHQSNINQESMQEVVNTHYGNESVPRFEARGDVVHGYTNQTFPSVGSEADYLTVTYYDDYAFGVPQEFEYDGSELEDQELEELSGVKGQVTGTKVKNLEDGSWYLSVNYYDDRYRVIQTVAENHGGGIDRTTNVYDFAGKILVTKTTHAIVGTSATSVTRTFDYDNAGRLTETHHKIDDGQNVLLTKNEYNELGQLVAKKLHSKDANSFAQQVDYRYNIRGWLTRINNSELDETEDHDPNETVNEDYFGMELSYETPFPETSAVAQFNGNISAIKWSTNLGLGQENQYDPELSRPKALAYGFTYDEMNRLEEATAYANIGGWQTSPAFHEKGISYDLNGNIRTLTRTTKDGSEMDVLDYRYGEGTDRHSNRLLSVTDAADDAEGFVDGTNGDDDYDYDANGNMILDKNKGITSIEYNHLNLPAKVIKGTEGYIKYIYDATGRKLAQEVYDENGLQKRTDYHGEFIYENDMLSFVNHEEGRIIPEDYEYQYHLKDHLGNVRLTFTTKEDSEESLATLETVNADEERAQFLYYDEAVKVNSVLFDHTHRTGGSNVPVTGVSLPSSQISMKVGQNTLLQATVAPSNATNKQVNWSSSDTDVAVVDNQGNVTAVDEGNATITATTVDGNFTANVSVTVGASSNLVANYEFDQGTSNWILYDYSGGGNSLSVVQDGALSGANSAHVDVVNTNNEGWRIQLAQHLDFDLEVGKTYEISFVARASTTRQLRVALTGSPSGATYWQPAAMFLSTEPQTFGPFQYTCNNSNVANETYFRLNFYLAFGVISEVWIDKVIIVDVTQPGAVTDVTVTPEALTLSSGQIRQLDATILPTNASNQSVSWASTNETVATVNSTGLVTAQMPGTAQIIATTADGGYTASTTINVKPVGTNLVGNHEFDEGLSGWTFRDWTSGGGNTATVVQNAGLSGGNALYVDIVSNDNSGWTINVNHPLDAAIEVGKTYEISFVAKAETPRSITAAIVDQVTSAAYWQQTVNITTNPQMYGPYQWTCNNNGGADAFNVIFMLAKGVISDVWIDKVIINDISAGSAVVSGINISPELTLTNGQVGQLASTILPSNAANQIVNWISSNTAVATVDGAGRVRAHSPGAATIIATTEDGGYQAQSLITVLPAGSTNNQNGEFDDGLEGWVLYDWSGPGNSNGGNSLSVVQGAGLSGANAAYVDVVNDNNAGWTLQLRQALNYRLEVGRTYEISFMAKAESARQVQAVIQGDPSNTVYANSTFNLTTSPQSFIYKFTCTNANVDNDNMFAFKFYLAKGVISDVWIDKVVIKDLSGGDGSAVLGNRIEAESYDAQSGLSVSGGALVNCELNDWARYDDVDLTGVKELRVYLASGGSVGNMEVRLGSVSGTLVATVPTLNTGGWSTYQSVTVPVAETTGVHDLFIVFKDRPAGGIMNVDWLELLGESPTVAVTGVDIAESNPSVQVGQTIRLTPLLTPADPAPTNQVVTWASSNTDIATVNANGDVTGVDVGTATITVTTEDGSFTDQVTVTVTEVGGGTYYSTRLSGSPTERYGLVKSLSVMPGDVIDIEVYAKYVDPDEQNWTPLFTNLIAAMSIPSGGILIDGGQPGSIGNETLPFTPIDNDGQAGDAPKAYLNYILTDRDFVPVDMGSKPITTAAREYGQNSQHERLFFEDVVVREPGYMYIYISNEGEELVDVFFDDLKVVHEKSSIVQHDDYYPFGLTFNSYQRENATPNRWKFQGQEHIDDLGLNWDSFKWRNHQPDIGRFFNVDPLAEKYAYNSTYAFCENKVTSHVELEGLEAVAFQVEGRGIVPVYGNLSVTASGAYGIVVGTRQGQDGIYAVQYVSGSLGPASGVGLAGGIGTYVHSGDLEDISGFGFGIGGFLGPTPTGLTGGSFELNTTTDGTQLGGLIPFASPGRAFGGGVWAEFSYTEFLDEPIRLTDMTEEATARLAESLGISVEQFTEFVNNATEYINSQQSQHQNELPSVEDIQKELEQKLIVPSDATRVNTN